MADSASSTTTMRPSAQSRGKGSSGAGAHFERWHESWERVHLWHLVSHLLTPCSSYPESFTPVQFRRAVKPASFRAPTPRSTGRAARTCWTRSSSRSSARPSRAGVTFDKLVKVWLKGGEERWLLIHVDDPETRSPADRKSWKLRLVKGLYERGMDAEDVRQLLRFIDWIMDLPQELEQRFQQELTAYQQEKHMPFITIFERVGMEKGLLEGIEACLRMKFGEEGLELMPDLRELHDHELLSRILNAIETAASPDDLRRVWTRKPPFEARETGLRVARTLDRPGTLTVASTPTGRTGRDRQPR